MSCTQQKLLNPPHPCHHRWPWGPSLSTAPALALMAPALGYRLLHQLKTIYFWFPQVSFLPGHWDRLAQHQSWHRGPMGLLSQEQEGDEAGGTRPSPSSNSQLPNWLKNPHGKHPWKSVQCHWHQGSLSTKSGLNRACPRHPQILNFRCSWQRSHKTPFPMYRHTYRWSTK